MSSFVILTITP